MYFNRISSRHQGTTNLPIDAEQYPIQDLIIKQY